MNKDYMEGGRFAYEGLERIFHEKARLGIMTSLMINNEGLLFNDLKTLCSLTDGNLSRHIQHLKEEGLVEVLKGFQNNRPQTFYRLTTIGKERFLAYLLELQKVVQDASILELEKKKIQDGHNLSDGWVVV